MLVSFLIEGIEIQSGKKKVKMDMYLGLDEEGGSYGGYNALVPSFVLNYV